MAIVQTGSVLRFPALGTGNTGTVSTTITVPADAEFVIAAWTGYSSTANYFSTGSMTFTKGGVDTTMTAVSGGDSNTADWNAAMFYLALPDTGANKTLKWDWAGTGVATAANSMCSVTFWKGMDTSSPVRGTGGGQAGAAPYTTGTITALTGDLIVAWAAANSPSEGTVDSWSNLTLLAQVAFSGDADGAWATGSPTGNTTVGTLTDTNFADGGIVAISLKPAAAASAPFVQADPGPTHDARWMLPRDLTRGLNPNLFKNPIPNNQTDWSKPFRVSNRQPDASQPFNPNLFKNPIPNNQTEWPQSFRVPHITPDSSRALNPNLQKNPVPNNQTDWSKPVKALQRLPDPPPPLNLNLFGFPSCGLVGIDQAGTGLIQTGVSSNTVDYTGVTVGGGANRALVAMVEVDVLTTGFAAVWDNGGTNQSMTLIGTFSAGGETVAIFGLRNPTAGNNTLRFSWSTAGFSGVTAVSLIGVDQSSDANAFRNFQSSNGNVASLSVTVPSAAGNLVLGIGGVAGSTVTSVGDNSIYIDNTSVGLHSGAGYNSGAPSVTFTGTASGSGNWVLGAIDVAAFPCTVSLPFLNVTGGTPFDIIGPTTPPQPYNLNLYSVVAAPFVPVDPPRSAGIPDWLPTPAPPLNLSLIANLGPFNQTDWNASRRLPDFLPDGSVSLNINLFTNPFPFAQFDWAKSVRLPALPPVPDTLNTNLFTPFPFSQIDWSKPFRVPRASVQPPDPLNINLFTNPYPFGQTDWSKPQQIKITQPRPAEGININLLTNPLPFAQVDQSAARLPRALASPDLAYNQSLYTVTVQAAPFNQMFWPIPQRARALPQPPDAFNPNLFTNPFPFAQTDWSAPARRQPLPDASQPFNPNLYGVVVVSVPFSQTDWPQTARPRPAPIASTSYNLNLFKNPIPFAQFEYPFARRVPAAPVDLSRSLNQNLFANPIPFAQYDWTPARKPLARLGDDPANFVVLVSVAPAAPLEEHSLPFFATPGRLMGM